ncbi:transposase, partial [Microcoleus sp. Pol11C1]|uniref:transposase n=1 Tax=unclassified Microcoleus TaxID=2642155 RepID=UPI002FD1BC61
DVQPILHFFLYPLDNLHFFLTCHKWVMDNATFHKGGRIRELIETAGCQLLYLPPYSPDLNKIEQCWSWLKSRIRKKLEQFDCLRDAIEDVLRQAS